VKQNQCYSAVLHLGCSALLGLGVYVSKALDAEPADLDRPDDTAEQREKKEITPQKQDSEWEKRGFLLKQQLLHACLASYFLFPATGKMCLLCHLVGTKPTETLTVDCGAALK